MLIIEGPDGAGKTTLIKKLSRALDIPIAPRVVSKDAEAMVDLQRWVDRNLATGFQRMLFDRHRLISEPIYGPALGRSSDGFNDLTWLAPRIHRFSRIKPIIIYCLPEKSTAWANVKDDPDNKVVADPDIFSSIYDSYVLRASLDRASILFTTFVWDYEHDLIDGWGLPAFTGRIAEALKNGTYND